MYVYIHIHIYTSWQCPHPWAPMPTSRCAPRPSQISSPDQQTQHQHKLSRMSRPRPRLRACMQPCKDSACVCLLCVPACLPRFSKECLSAQSTHDHPIQSDAKCAFQPVFLMRWDIQCDLPAPNITHVSTNNHWNYEPACGHTFAHGFPFVCVYTCVYVLYMYTCVCMHVRMCLCVFACV